MLFRISESLVNIGQFLKINEIANCFAIQLRGQNRTDFFDLAVEDSSGGR
jgi:hypothetical protein